MLALLGAWLRPFRLDLTDDKRYSLSPTTKALLRSTEGEIELTSYLLGDLNPSLRRLQRAVRATAEEMGATYREQVYTGGREALRPTLIHERTQAGRSAQTEVYPYVRIVANGDTTWISLLHNQRGLSGEENLNRSIENLEFSFAQALLPRRERREVRILDGHDLQTREARAELDRYLMEGGRALLAIDGVQTQTDMLVQEGQAPVLAANEELREQLYHYGVRIEAGWIEDKQCIRPPYYFAPLLLTAQNSPITRNLGQVSTTMASPVTIVGGEDGIEKEVLLASSTASRVQRAPGMIIVGETDESSFRWAYIPVAVALEGELPSAFRHLGATRDKSVRTRLIVAGSSSLLREGMAGLSNDEFMQNALAWLADDEGLLSLRSRTVSLRLLNDERAYRHIGLIRTLAVAVPLLVLALLALICIIIHHKKYTL